MLVKNCSEIFRLSNKLLIADEVPCDIYIKIPKTDRKSAKIYGDHKSIESDRNSTPIKRKSPKWQSQIKLEIDRKPEINVALPINAKNVLEKDY